MNVLSKLNAIRNRSERARKKFSLKKYLIFIFISCTFTAFSQVKKIKVKKETIVSDTADLVGVWYSKVLNDVGTGTFRIWEFKADGTFIEKRGNDGNVFYEPRPDGKYNLNANVLDIFQTSADGKPYNLIYTVEKKKDFLLLTLTKDSKNTGPGKQMKLTRKLY